MKKLFVLLTAFTLALTLSACNDNGENVNVQEEGDVLNIRVWNDEFIGRFRNYYPGYLETKSNGQDLLDDGTIVNWIQVANDNNGYQNALDTALQNQDSAAADDKIDMFLIEADYAKKYANENYALDVINELGIPENSLSQQYQYTKDIVTDDDGVLRAVSWQATPGLFAYRADIAEEVLGTSDPDQVQILLEDWTKFDNVASDMAADGYAMISGFDDAYRAYSNNTDAPWVDEDGKIIVDDQIIKWIEQTKIYTDNGYNNETNLWSDGWFKDMGPEGNAFGYFFSTWGINFTLLDASLADADQPKEVGNGLYGEYRVIEGPASFYWGGTWLVGAKGTDNPTLVRDIMLKMTANEEIMKNITLDTEDYTNHQGAMDTIANDEDYGSNFLGGQNHIALFNESADNIDMSNISPYDQGLNESIQNSFKDYFLGTSTWEEAWAAFEEKVSTLYPELELDEVPDDPFA
ncbi:MAG: carbohydrate ABC transporter substrate-binding protein [Candidatus Izemoplasmatales bacterium]